MTDSFEIPMEEQGQPQPQAEPQAQPEPQAEPQPDMLDFNADGESFSVPREAAEAWAKATGRDVEDIVGAFQIGWAGNGIFGQLREKERALWERERAIAERERTPQPQPQSPVPQPRSALPPPNDVYGRINWLAEEFANTAPLFTKVSEIERKLDAQAAKQEQDSTLRMQSEERVVAMRAYNEVSEAWKKDPDTNGVALPSYRQMESMLRKYPFQESEDTWNEVWDKLGWVMAGRDIAKRARRQAVLNSQKPDAVLQVPGSSGPVQRPKPNVPNNGDLGDNPTEEGIAALEAQLQGVTFNGAYGTEGSRVR